MPIRAILPIAQTRLVTIACTALVFEVGCSLKTDVVRQVSTYTGCSGTTIISDTMARKVIICHLEDELIDVWTTKKNNALKQIPINNHQSRPLVLLYTNDALQAPLKDTGDENLFLRDYAMGIGYGSC